MPKDNHDCDLRDDIKCYQPLTEIDLARIKDSLFSYIKNTSLITDTTARRDCDSARVWFDFALQLGAIFRGRTDSFHVDTAGKGHRHESQSYTNGDGTRANTQAIHIDPRHLDAAKTPFGKRAVLQMIYHEVGHAVNGVNHSDDSTHAAAGYPGTPYYSTIHSGACFQ